MSENRPVYDWQTNVPMTVWQQEADRDMAEMAQEIIRLQERVSALERAQSRPDNAFWGQLMFDVGMVICLALMLLLWR